jgi:hypothetical protein
MALACTSETNATGLGGSLKVVVSGVKEKKRTLVALLAASVISLVVWGLVVALNVR